ncbi:MAG TPA: hypothetical protein VH207_03410 [Chthoniobacterales bacterium]|jgi:hypothetical protein|nr:hypothetical protein [Chthoniobacterales bacterium]
MIEGDPWIAVRFGCYAAAAHFLFAVFIAILVATGGSSSAELWLFIGIVDTPMNLLLLPLLDHLPCFDLWPPVSFLSGRLASWDFLFSSIYFVVLGTAFWFLLGWLFGRLTHRLRYGHWTSYEAI